MSCYIQFWLPLFAHLILIQRSASETASSALVFSSGLHHMSSLLVFSSQNSATKDHSPTICRLNTVLFTKCGHSAQTLTICGFNGFFPPHPCSLKWSGGTHQHHGACRGCRAILRLRCSGRDQVISSIKDFSKKMPFSYVVYGKLPMNRAEGIQRARTEHMLIRIMDFGTDPLEEMMSEISTSDVSGGCSWERTPNHKKTSVWEKPSPISAPASPATPPPFKQSTITKTLDGPFEKPVYRTRTTKSAPSRVAKDLQPCLKTKAPSLPSRRTPSTLLLNTTSSSQVPISQCEPEKSVRFARHTEVQYFKNMAIRFTKDKL